MPDDTLSPADSDSLPDSGPVIAEISYDGLGRRIAKTITNSGDWNKKYHYYYGGFKIVEVRDGSSSSNYVLAQYVWGLGYIDELVSVRWNYFPGSVPITNTYFAMQDANYNVLGLVDSDGELVERYEYTPYGQRTVFSHAHIMTSDYDNDGDVDINDYLIQKANYGMTSGATHAMGDSDADGDIDIFDFLILKSEYGDVTATTDSLQHYPSQESYTTFNSMGLCPIGHQGLYWDKEFGQYNNRARTLHSP